MEEPQRRHRSVGVNDLSDTIRGGSYKPRNKGLVKAWGLCVKCNPNICDYYNQILLYAIKERQCMCECRVQPHRIVATSGLS